MDVVRVRSHSRTNPVRAPERDTVRHSLPPCCLKLLRGSLPGWGVAPRYSYYGVTTGWMVGAPPIRDSLSLKVPPVPAWQHFICNSPFAGRPPPTQPYLSTVHVCRTCGGCAGGGGGAGLCGSENRWQPHWPANEKAAGSGRHRIPGRQVCE